MEMVSAHLAPSPTDWQHVTPQPYYSMVVPMYNEEASAAELYAALSRNLAALGKPYEIIFIDDGSSDSTYEKLCALGQADAHVLVIQLRRNFGQTPALAAGFCFRASLTATLAATSTAEKRLTVPLIIPFRYGAEVVELGSS